MSILVFVYGTLKHGYSNNYLLRNSTCLGRVCTITSQYGLFCNGLYPCLVRSKDGGIAVYGELYQVDRETLQALDWLEGVDHGLYERKLVTVSVEDAYETNANVYLYLGDTKGMTEVKSGEWNGPEQKTEARRNSYSV